jgi:hypothetical protein
MDVAISTSGVDFGPVLENAEQMQSKFVGELDEKVS